jgi:putative oxidoreductase
MSFISNFQNWTESHNPRWLALLRLALGASLILRGVNFLNETPELEKLINASALSNYTEVLKHIIPWVHVVGGFLIIIGMFTRFAAFIQIPVLLGAVTFIHAKKSIFTLEVDLSYSILILTLLLVFVIEGSGKLSLAYYFKELADQQNATVNSDTA